MGYDTFRRLFEDAIIIVNSKINGSAVIIDFNDKTIKLKILSADSRLSFYLVFDSFDSFNILYKHSSQYLSLIIIDKIKDFYMKEII